MDKGAWWAILHGVTKSWTQLNTHIQPNVISPRNARQVQYLKVDQCNQHIESKKEKPNDPIS